MQKNILLFAMIVGCFAFEVISISQQWIYRFQWLPWIVFVLDVMLFLWIYFRQKSAIFRLIVIRSLKSATGSLIGVAFIIYLLVHIGFIQDRLQEIWAGNESWHYLAIVLAVFPIPFLANALMTKYEYTKMPPDKRRVMITALSLFDNQEREARTIDLNPSVGKRSREAEIVNEILTKKHWTDWDSKVRVPWKPIFQSIELFPKLNKVVVLVTHETQLLRERIKTLNSTEPIDIDQLIMHFYPNITVQFESLRDGQLIEKNVEDLKSVVRYRLGSIRDEEIVFASTGGTAAISGALAMMAAKGSRGFVYVRQDNNQPVENTINIYQIEDLWEDLLIIGD